MVLEKIINYLEAMYPLKLQEEWDNIGLLIGDKKKEVQKISVCLDVTEDIVSSAIENKVDLIISHHPIIFSGIKRINTENVLGRKLLNLIKNDISVYSIHTNADMADGGLNDYILEIIGLNGQVEKTEEDLIRIVELSETKSTVEIANQIKEKLGIEKVRMIGENKDISKLAIMTGSGSSFISKIIGKVDLFITGDIKHHEALDAAADRLNILDIGHYESEVMFTDMVKRELSKIFTGEIKIEKGKPVFKIM